MTAARAVTRIARATTLDVESRENDFDASFRARATPFTTRDAPKNRLDPSARLGQGFRTHRIARSALLVEPRSRALTSNEMSLICERKITFVSHSFASRSRILRRDALRPNVRALIHRASDPNTPSVRSSSRRHALDARRRDARAKRKTHLDVIERPLAEELDFLRGRHVERVAQRRVSIAPRARWLGMARWRVVDGDLPLTVYPHEMS